MDMHRGQVATRLVVVSGLCLVFGACDMAAEGENADQVEGTQEALNGVATVDPSCAAYRSKITSAMSMAYTQLNDSRMLPCLKDSMLVWPGFGYPERVLAQMPSSAATIVKCGDWERTTACQSNPETICLSNNDATLRPVANMAGLILHEVAHMRGYSHAGYYNQSFNEQLEACAYSISQGDNPAHGNLLARSKYKYETELASVGGADDGDGSRFYAGCNTTEFVGGWDVRTSSNLSGLRLRCRTSGGAETVMPWQPSSSAGTTTTQNCSSDELLVGIHGKADTDINGVGVICQRRSSVAGGSASGRRTIPAVGGVTGVAFERMCPVGMAVRSIRGRLAVTSPSSILRLRPMCESVKAPVTQLHAPAGTIGQASPAWREERACADHGAINGLTSASIPGLATPLLTLLYGHCTATDTVFKTVNGQPAVDYVVERTPTAKTWLPAEGTAYQLQTGMVDTSADCANGSAFVGVRGYVKNGFIAGVRGMCAPIATWSDLDREPAPGKVLSTLHGTTGGASATDVLCPRGAFVSGLDLGRDNATVDANSLRSIGVICRQLSYLPQ
jgi:hypothetical protein